MKLYVRNKCYLIINYNKLCILHGSVVDEVDKGEVDMFDVVIEVALLVVVVVDNRATLVVVGLDFICSVVVDVLIVVVVEIVVIGPMKD